MSKGKDIAKQIGPIVLIGGGLFAAYKIFKAVFPGETKAAASVQTAATYATQQIQAGVQPSFSDFSYQTMADTIYGGMRYSWFDDNYPIVEATLKLMKNDVDVAKLIAAYGLRQETWFGVIPDGPAKNLPTQVTDDLDSDRIGRINADYLSKGIKFRF